MTSDIDKLLQSITQQPQSRLAKIGERSAMIVHEVRNPLTTILMALQSFENLNLPETSQQRLNLALEEADRLQHLLNEILQYAKPYPLEYSALEVNALMTNFLELIQMMPKIADRKIVFIPAPEPISLLGNADKLKQVMINLLTNACEASPVEDEITWQVVPLAADNAVRIQVHNWGLPISPQALPHLTTSFFTTKPSGSGLGLAIVKQIVEDHGGQLHIESTLQSGTRVSVQLPAPSI
ncbi:sensor histidine kinase [Acaryochloris thomasi]|uniref:sensor histidine kinase n=1 Tax=Acaryochloris thomasi TaxID=2929456 RepID=UPI001314C8E7|nr:ATP-binding protein [Acaryochloris thomasi]